jgi:hypothetical protein
MGMGMGMGMGYGYGYGCNCTRNDDDEGQKTNPKQTGKKAHSPSSRQYETKIDADLKTIEQKDGLKSH